jgi:hypothetical protein
MAGDWIKMRGNLWDDPRVTRIVDLTDSSEAAVVGGLYWLWATADQHTTDGVMLGLSIKGIDRKTGIKGFGDALVLIGWIADHPEGIRIVDFEQHNGTSAKKRCQTAKRVANFTAKQTEDEVANDEVTQEEYETNAPSVSDALAREEKRREDSNTSLSSAKLPTAPHLAIIDLYHAALPELPACRVESDSRKRAISSFWKWVFTSKRSDGQPRASTEKQALDWIDAYFRRTRDNDFLMGRLAQVGVHANWRCDLDFLLADKGRKQVIEKTRDAA